MALRIIKKVGNPKKEITHCPKCHRRQGFPLPAPSHAMELSIVSTDLTEAGGPGPGQMQAIPCIKHSVTLRSCHTFQKSASFLTHWLTCVS